MEQFRQFVLRIIDAFKHVRSGGRTTRTRAVRKAAAPPAKCPTCRREVPHSPDWRDHLNH